MTFNRRLSRKDGLQPSWYMMVLVRKDCRIPHKPEESAETPAMTPMLAMVSENTPDGCH